MTGENIDRSAIVHKALKLFGPNPARDCSVLRSRFRQALMTANPGLSEEQMQTYDTAFEAEFSSLVEATRNAHVAAVSEALTDEQAATWKTIVELPEIEPFLGSLRSFKSEIVKATQAVFASAGTQMHARSADLLFNALASVDKLGAPSTESEATAASTAPTFAGPNAN